MSIAEKQMRAIRKVAVKLYAHNPSHFEAVISAIDSKLSELETIDDDFNDFDN